MVRPRFLISVLTLALACIPAQASIVYYSTPASFNTAATAAGDTLTTVSFNQFAGPASATETDSVTGTVFSTPTGSLDGIANPGGTWPTGDVLDRTTAGSGAQVYITITPPAGTMAFELYLGNLAPGSANGITFVTVSATGCSSPGFLWDGGCGLDPAPAIGTPNFIGVVSDTAITSIIVSADGGTNQYVGIGGFELGAPAPEATTPILIGSGLILLPWLHRRLSPRRRKMA